MFKQSPHRNQRSKGGEACCSTSSPGHKEDDKEENRNEEEENKSEENENKVKGGGDDEVHENDQDKTQEGTEHQATEEGGNESDHADTGNGSYHDGTLASYEKQQDGTDTTQNPGEKVENTNSRGDESNRQNVLLEKTENSEPASNEKHDYGETHTSTAENENAAKGEFTDTSGTTQQSTTSENIVVVQNQQSESSSGTRGDESNRQNVLLEKTENSEPASNEKHDSGETHTSTAENESAAKGEFTDTSGTTQQSTTSENIVVVQNQQSESSSGISPYKPTGDAMQINISYQITINRPLSKIVSIKITRPRIKVIKTWEKSTNNTLSDYSFIYMIFEF
ncbi:hypothetical protein PanWU01x14_333440 [Parasponia andersonii]|uniref:Uncharacterized protein n=1 Tax=Parasponia andersonii TaxID=3476 RepID=A0A2P5AGW4_PARAD|nr:hypothetical protein PanWU01x14_333440 [Parasponia andersonii]